MAFRHLVGFEGLVGVGLQLGGILWGYGYFVSSLFSLQESCSRRVSCSLSKLSFPYLLLASHGTLRASRRQFGEAPSRILSVGQGSPWVLLAQNRCRRNPYPGLPLREHSLSRWSSKRTRSTPMEIPVSLRTCSVTNGSISRLMAEESLIKMPFTRGWGGRPLGP